MKRTFERLSRKRHTSIGRILENTAWLLGGKGVGGILSLFYLAIVTRTLGPAGFGHFAMILSTAQIVVTFVSFETWRIIVKFGQDHVRDGDAARLGRLAAFCVAIDLAGALLGAVAAIIAILLLGPHFGWSQTVSIEALAFAAVMLFTIRSTPTGILRLFDRFDVGTLAETMIPVGRMIGAVAVWAYGADLTGFLIAWAAAELLCAATYWVLAVRTLNEKAAGWRGARFLQARLENKGIMAFLTATNISTTVGSLTKQVSVLVVGFFAGATDAGLYRLAYQISISLSKISTLLSRTIFAELARVSASRPMSDLVRLFRRTNRIALIASAVIVLLVATLGQTLLVLMGGQAFAGAYPLLLLLGIAAALELIGISFEPLLLATGRAVTSVRIQLISALMLLCLFALLLPRYGALGAAITTLINAASVLLMLGGASRRALKDAAAMPPRADPAG